VEGVGGGGGGWVVLWNAVAFKNMVLPLAQPFIKIPSLLLQQLVSATRLLTQALRELLASCQI
jgi:hypothetical protein